MTKEAKGPEELGYVIVRPYELKDQRTLIALLKENNPESRPGLSRASGYILAENERRLVGAVFCSYRGSHVMLQDLVVKTAHRRQGVAAALVGEAERRAKENGATMVEVVADNNKLANYYENLGFARVRPKSMKLAKALQSS